MVFIKKPMYKMLKVAKKLENTIIKFTYSTLICPFVAYALLHMLELYANLLSFYRSLTSFSEHSEACYGLVPNNEIICWL